MCIVSSFYAYIISIINVIITVLINFQRSCLEQPFGLCAQVANKRSAPRRVALVPQPEVVDEDGMLVRAHHIINRWISHACFVHPIPPVAVPLAEPPRGPLSSSGLTHPQHKHATPVSVADASEALTQLDTTPGPGMGTSCVKLGWCRFTSGGNAT